MRFVLLLVNEFSTTKLNLQQVHRKIQGPRWDRWSRRFFPMLLVYLGKYHQIQYYQSKQPPKWMGRGVVVKSGMHNLLPFFPDGEKKNSRCQSNNRTIKRIDDFGTHRIFRNQPRNPIEPHHPQTNESQSQRYHSPRCDCHSRLGRYKYAIHKHIAPKLDNEFSSRVSFDEVGGGDSIQ